MKKILILGIFICFGAMYSFGQDDVDTAKEIWTTSEWYVQKFPVMNGCRVKLVSKKEARARIMRYCAIYNFYNFDRTYADSDFFPNLIYATEFTHSHVSVGFINKDNGYVESLNFFTKKFISDDKKMDQTSIERIIDSWLRILR